MPFNIISIIKPGFSAVAVVCVRVWGWGGGWGDTKRHTHREIKIMLGEVSALAFSAQPMHTEISIETTFQIWEFFRIIF